MGYGYTLDLYMLFKVAHGGARISGKKLYVYNLGIIMADCFYIFYI
jgi:hypothetical protein